VGVPTQPSLAAASRGRGPGRRGLALPSAMFALVAIAVLLGGIFVFADLNARSVENRERATRAVHVAEAGINHAMGLLRGSLRMHGFTRILRGSDNATGTLLTSADDSLFINWPGLAAQDQIPLAGQTYQGHTYFVTVADDPADNDGNPQADMNGRVRLWCRAVTTEGATAVVEAIVGSVPQPGVATDGNANYSGSPQVLGACGSMHANGNISGGGSPVVAINATGTGTAGGNFRLPNGSNAPELGGQPEVPIPDLNPLNFCAGQDYRLTAAGTVIPAATGIPEDATGTAKYGWKRSGSSPVKWDFIPPAFPGTFCVEGNVTIGATVGLPGAPLKMSVIATGSIDVSGDPFLTADHDDGILFLAGGDISIQGNPGLGDNFGGLVYAGAQCKTDGNFKLSGQLMCNNGPQPAGSIDHTATHVMSGNWIINYDCGANVFNKRRILFWYPRIGT
jgi:hypothetical protein